MDLQTNKDSKTGPAGKPPKTQSRNLHCELVLPTVSPPLHAIGWNHRAAKKYRTSWPYTPSVDHSAKSTHMDSYILQAHSI